MTGEILLLATTNPGKVREIRSILKGIPYRILTIGDLPPSRELIVKETGESFRENAILKATGIGRRCGFLTLADDSGLEIDALEGKPGVRSARFARGEDAVRINKVLKLLRGIPDRERSARFKAVVAIFDPKRSQIQAFEGTVEGKIMKKPAGTAGFGYDPIFWADEIKKSFAQASPTEKNRISHRAKALKKAKKFLMERGSGARGTVR